MPKPSRGLDLAETAAGLRAHGQTGYLVSSASRDERTAMRQAGARRVREHTTRDVRASSDKPGRLSLRDVACFTGLERVREGLDEAPGGRQRTRGRCGGLEHSARVPVG